MMGGKEQEWDGERGREKPFMIKNVRSQYRYNKLEDDTSHGTTKGKNIGWGPFYEKLMESSLKELSLL